MEKRAIVMALALTLPLALYGIPYAYASVTTSTYSVATTGSIGATGSTIKLTAQCHPGDFATGGGYNAPDGVFGSVSAPNPASPSEPTEWTVILENVGTQNPNGGPVAARAVCMTPVTVAGIGVPEFGSLYVAIALGAVAYFLMARRLAKSPAASLGVSP